MSAMIAYFILNPTYPVISNPLMSGRLMPNVKLVTGANVISHGLQRRLRGYFVVMMLALPQGLIGKARVERV